MSETWINKINNFSSTPPKESWENIAQVLDKEKNTNWIERIKHEQEEVPAFVWDTIQEKLDENKAKVISIGSRKWLFKMAAAAVIVTVLSVGLWKSLNNKNNIEKPDISAVTPIDNNTVQPIRNSISEKTNSNATSETQEIEMAKHTPVIKPNENPKSQKKETATDVVLVTDPFENDNTKIETTTATNVDMLTVPNTYVTVAGPNGQLVKVSSKFSKLLGVVNDNKADPEKLDMIIDQSKFWSAKFKQWREKMLHNNVTASPDNFMDILELINTVNEKN